MMKNKYTNHSRIQVSASEHRRITFRSPDRQTEIAVVSEGGLRRWPPHDGKVAVVRLRPQKHTRIRVLPDGRLEVVFRHSEILGLLYALNACETGGFLYELPKANHKSAKQREMWQRINEERLCRRQGR